MNYLDTIHYKNLHKLYYFLSYKNHNNIIIISNINNKVKYIKILLSDLNYDYFYIKKFNKNEILNIIKTKNYHNKIKYILLENIDLNNFKIIKKFIDKYNETSRFIIITDKINNNHSIISYFTIIKFFDLSKYDKIIYRINDYHDNNKFLINKLFLIYEKYSLIKMKEYSYNLILINIKYHIYFRELLEYILELNINFNKKIDITNHISNYEYLMKKAYKEIIFFESLFIKIYKIIYIDKVIT